MAYLFRSYDNKKQFIVPTWLLTCGNVCAIAFVLLIATVGLPGPDMSASTYMVVSVCYDLIYIILTAYALMLFAGFITTGLGKRKPQG